MFRINIEKIHSDIVENILSRLPIGTALHAKRVCTTWRAILRSRTEKPGYLFYQVVVHGDYVEIPQLFYEDEYDHYDRAKINYYHSYNTLTKIEHDTFSAEESPRTVMIGSCNGLVCFGQYTKEDVKGADPFLICNPLTGESVFLPRHNYSELPRARDISTTVIDPDGDEAYGRLSSGFGYCPSTNDYKVVTIYYYPDENKGHVQVYTVGGEPKWRYIGYKGRCYTLSNRGIYANVALHWLHKGDPNVKGSNKIVAFDLEGEKFRSISLPRSNIYRTTYYRYHPLKLLGGNNNLYLIHTNHRASCIDIWVYKKRDLGKSSSPWSKEFSIQLKKPYSYKPFAITRGNEVLLWYRSRCFGTRLRCYDPVTSTLNKLWDDEANGAEYVKIRAIPHMQSVVSLKDLGETDVASLKDLDQNTEAKGGSEKILEKSIRSSAAKRRKNC